MNAHTKPDKNSVKAAPQSVTTGPIIGSRKIYVPTPEDADDPRAVPRGAADDRHRAAGADLRPVRALHRDRCADRPERRPAADPPGLARRRAASTPCPAAPSPPPTTATSRPRQLVPACPAQRPVLTAQDGQMATQYEFARAGIVTPEMIYVAHRENLGRAAMLEGAKRAPCRWRELRRQRAGIRDAGVRALRDRARARHHPGQHQPSRAGADGDRPQLPGQDQRQYRQFGRDLGRGRGGREAGLGDPLGRRHGHGSLHRPQHPQHPLLDPAQLAGADRHGADLPGAGEGRRRPDQARLGGVQGHADRAGRAGRRLLHHPCRRAAALCAADGHRASPASSRAAARSWRAGAWRITRRASSTSVSTRSATSCANTTSRSRSATGCVRARSPTPTTAPSSPSWRRWAS